MLLAPTPLTAAPAPSTPAGATDPVAELRAQMEALRRDYETRMAALEARLAELETGAAAGAETAAETAPPSEDEALARLKAAARAAAGEASAAATAEPAAPAVGRERNLNRLNPEISLTGIFLGTAAEGGREEFRAEEFELDLQSALDPFSRTRWTLAYGPGEGDVEIEEGWIQYNALPGGLSLTGGKLRQRFGTLNRQHLHALPQVDYPLALTTFFGDEGLAQTGLSLDWVVPHPWASANELTVELTNGENETAFGGELFDQLALLAHLKNFWDLSDAAWLEWGLSGVAGETAQGGTSRVWGTDLTYHWQPPRRAKYRELTWRTELLLSERDDDLGRRRRALGGTSYLEGLAAQSLYLGLRADWVEDPLDPARETWALVPYVTWWQSEYVRLRGEFRHFGGDLDGGRELGDVSKNQLFLQLTWAAGPHKHETY
jgi:hypothetical protein